MSQASLPQWLGGGEVGFPPAAVYCHVSAWCRPLESAAASGCSGPVRSNTDAVSEREGLTLCH